MKKFFERFIKKKDGDDDEQNAQDILGTIFGFKTDHSSSSGSKPSLLFNKSITERETMLTDVQDYKWIMQRQVQTYDPYAFIKNMATPFDIPKDATKEKTDDSNIGFAVTETLPHCKACTDFKTWMKLTANPKRKMSPEEREKKECPLDSKMLGRKTWGFLHTMAAYYPDEPTTQEQTTMANFIELFSQFYPCQKCAKHLREELKTNTPNTKSAEALSMWFCELHNKVNSRLGKAEFDCSKVLERWRDGWADGSCD